MRRSSDRDPVNESDRFWILWNPNGNEPPRVRFTNLVAAERARDNMARQHPGNEFIVMQSVSSARAIDIEVTRFTEPAPF